MKKIVLLFAATVAGATFSAACIAFPSCPEHFREGRAPEFTSRKMAEKTTPLCFESYAVMHSGVSRTPLWSAERVERDKIKLAVSIKRRNAFHPEQRLAPAHRAELRDYARSGWDRGHMTPSANMASEDAQRESFSLANIIPQHPENNQNVWASIEERTRSLARQRGKLYVVTGPMFEGASLLRINGRVLVPTHVFKAIFDPVRREAGAYITENQPGSGYRTVSIAELEKRININLFPGLADEIKQRQMALPKPVQRRKQGPQRASDDDDRVRQVRRILEAMS